ncbi:helix-turn-helix transcriptional regulator [Novosphingobium sp.]|uniref:helix-turn-helix domain-containing protein n=1 Tax=Novosphingobium sp. TaxID=1874826 RepID=UPI0025E8D7E3|nr:helix-turn-helix transcriptional regulator [Novosphingobium sp.]
MRDLQATLAANVKRLRAALGVSQEELAERSGLHRTYIGGIERGERNITLASLERIASALGTEPSLLIGSEQ